MDLGHPGAGVGSVEGAQKRGRGGREGWTWREGSQKRGGITTAAARYKVFLLAGEGEMSDSGNGGMMKRWKEERG